MILSFVVYGVALPKGNHRAVMHHGMHFPVITESNRGVASWQQLVKEGASHALDTIPEFERRLLIEGVRVSIAFVLPRPKSLPKGISAHTKQPDTDKLVRGILDSMSGTVYRDDCQVCELVASKRYAAIGESAHVTIRVEPTAGVIPIAPADQPRLLLAMEREAVTP